MEYIKIENGMLANNTYLVYKEKEAILIDPSLDFELIDKVVSKNNFKITAILITHGHYDHIGSVEKFAEKYNVFAYGHKYTMESLSNPEYNLSKLSPNFAGELICKCDTKVLEEGKQVIEGFDVEVIFTPGHSRGCTSYIIGDNIFTGDFIFKGTVGRMDLLTSSPQAMNESIRKFLKLRSDLVVLPGHGPDSTVDFECKTNIFVREIGG